ncbi:hypothetical protein LY28_01636 [Ruminiclostridium sufflavum DSM 19573]|uniref:Amidohydrolase-related domain-containing protein n=1 Tax=Ruminiclostridium sufflavum DSM 19573 TaxID=1121337 RepID=A0A318XME3_9FIRM|nr:amidohydrolase family protein [Ruminiclostridium sufflavum]PYG87926.1 hypothetical protein LY28_01636 [Ruminiclostridium sufflavum DSM 19573]
MIFDIHSHIKRDYKNQEKLEEDLLADMKKNNISLRVVSTLEGKSIREQNDYISDFASRHPQELVGCAVINPKEFDSVEETKRALGLPGIRMLEFNSLEHGYYPDSCANINEILEIAEAKSVPVKVFVGLGARAIPQQWAAHTGKYPEIKFVFLHMGCFDYGYGCVDLALNNNNIYVETSNQYEVQILKKAFTKLDKGKIVFGSSYPERITKCSIDVFDMFHLDKDYLEGILSGSFESILAQKQ